MKTGEGRNGAMSQTSGRWPANLIHDGSEEVVGLFPDAKSGRSNGLAKTGQSGKNTPLRRGALISRNDSGSAARFFYCAKASPKDRNSGLSDKDNDHPTVKPTDLMRYLCRLVTPPGGTVLDPFMGSGSTGKGAILEGFNFIGMELDPHYCELAEKRIGSVKVNVTLDEIFT
jgi:site-specific DNA-methyltransferase (adenine-specific)